MTTPVLLTLDLWSLGHGALQIAEMLGVPRWKVYQTVAQAREIGDPRATVHVTARGVVAGSPRAARRVLLEHPDVELVPMVRRVHRGTHCPHGHEWTPESTLILRGSGGRWCRTCGRKPRGKK